MPETVRVYIGSEPMQRVCCEVLKSSILRRTERPVEFHESWRWKQWHPLYEKLPRLKQGTGFSLWRWCVPMLCDYAGKAIYLDSDQVILADIGELWDSLVPPHHVACVCSPDGIWAIDETLSQAAKRKGWDWLNTPQTSVMVMDCAACRWNPFDLAKWVQEEPKTRYPRLMRGEFIGRDNIKAVDPGWNAFGVRWKDTKLVHFSHVGSQPWRCLRHPLVKFWRSELRESILAGHLSEDVLRAEVKAGHVDKHFLNYQTR